ncbi:unnamed protein product, partial [Polarella glacialis]
FMNAMVNFASLPGCARNPKKAWSSPVRNHGSRGLRNQHCGYHFCSTDTLKLSKSISAATRHSLKLDRRSVLDFKFALEALSLENADGLQYLQGICTMQATL